MGDFKLPKKVFGSEIQSRGKFQRKGHASAKQSLKFGAIFPMCMWVTTTFYGSGQSPIFGARYASGRAEARDHT